MAEDNVTLSSVLDGAIEEFEQWIKDNPKDDDPHEAISEIEDQGVPIYTYDLLRCAIDDLWLATETPDIPSEEPSAVTCISGNIYQRIEEQLWDVWRNRRDDILAELAEDEDEDDDLPTITDEFHLLPSTGLADKRGNPAWLVLSANEIEDDGVDELPYQSDFWAAFNAVVGLAAERGQTSVTIMWDSNVEARKTARIRLINANAMENIGTVVYLRPAWDRDSIVTEQGDIWWAVHNNIGERAAQLFGELGHFIGFWDAFNAAVSVAAKRGQRYLEIEWKVLEAEAKTIAQARSTLK